LALIEEADLDRAATVFEAAARRQPRQRIRLMIAVPNTTPLRYLMAIDQAHLLDAFVQKSVCAYRSATRVDRGWQAQERTRLRIVVALVA
jgi:hypothetical protein